MKIQTTQKNILNSFEHVVQAPYCALQHVFAGTEPTAYTAGKYGWNADIYDVGGGIAIVTGYRPFGEKIDRDFFPAWEAAAQKAIAGGSALTETIRDMAGALHTMLTPPDAATIREIADLVAVAEKMSNAYFFKSPATAGGRRSYEQYYSRPAVEWHEGGHSYSAAFDVSCSCKNVYARGYYYKDGAKTTLTAIKKSLDRLKKED